MHIHHPVPKSLNGDVETQGNVGVQAGSSSVSTDEHIQDGSKVQVSNSRIHIMRRGCVTQRRRGSGGWNERCQTLTTPSLRPQVQSPTAHIVVWASISSHLADFMLSRQCGIDEKTRMSGPYDRLENATFKFGIPTAYWHLSIRNGIQTF